MRRRDIRPSPFAQAGEPYNLWRDIVRGGIVVTAIFAVIVIALLTLEPGG